jgi:hypothetical protein
MEIWVAFLQQQWMIINFTVSADVLLCTSVENQKKKQFGTFFFCYYVLLMAPVFNHFIT